LQRKKIEFYIVGVKRRKMKKKLEKEEKYKKMK